MIFHSFYARLSLLFLVLVLALGAVSLAIAFQASGHLFDEVEQLLNREYASSIALELQPLVKEGFSEESIMEAIHYMMVLNPMVEIYLLDDKGGILSYFTHPAEQLERPSIQLEPLLEYLNHQGNIPVLGDDPRTKDALKPFSAATLDMGGESGYVYVILRGQSYDRSIAMLRSNYYLQSGFRTFVFALILTLAAGLSLSFLLTRRLSILYKGVMAFQQGDFRHRVKIGGSDELSILGEAFNEMARSIEEGIDQLHQAENQRSELIANISHDLRSPLTSIRGHLETLLVKGKDLSGEQQREFLQISLKNVDSYQRLVEELFELAKLEARQVFPQTDSFHPSELIQDVLLKLKPLAEKQQIRLQWEPREDLSWLTADIGMIERVLTNILENAIYHTPSEGMVFIDVTEKESLIQMEILDSGPGIATEDLPHIFERFYRADKSRNRNIPGTGLGLAIAKEIMDLHKGKISAENSPRGGALFRLELPLYL